MKLVKVIKNGQVVQPVRFDNDADMNQWIQMLADTAAWGLPERWLPDSIMSPLSEEQKAMALESRTMEVMGEQVVEYRLPSEYKIDVQDITAEVQAEKSAKEAKKLAKEKRKDDRKKLDWSKVNSVAELKAIVKSLVEELED